LAIKKTVSIPQNEENFLALLEGIRDLYKAQGWVSDLF